MSSSSSEALNALMNQLDNEARAGSVSGVRSVVNELLRLSKAATLPQPASAAIPAQPAVPEGWKLVPVEPTEEMFDAAFNLPHDMPHPQSVWEAMLAAAPSPSEKVREGATPRTDAALLDAFLKHSFPNASFVHADFARQLERELAALRHERNVLQKICAERSDELESLRSASAETEQWKRWAEYAKAEYLKATGRELPQDEAS